MLVEDGGLYEDAVLLRSVVVVGLPFGSEQALVVVVIKHVVGFGVVVVVKADVVAKLHGNY